MIGKEDGKKEINCIKMYFYTKQVMKWLIFSFV